MIACFLASKIKKKKIGARKKQHRDCPKKIRENSQFSIGTALAIGMVLAIGYWPSEIFIFFFFSEKFSELNSARLYEANSKIKKKKKKKKKKMEVKKNHDCQKTCPQANLN